MSKRDPFVFSFVSPYDLSDTVNTFRDVLCDVYASYSRYTGCTEVLALKPDQAPPLTSEIYVRPPTTPNSPGEDLIELVVGNRAVTYWAANIEFRQDDGMTVGYVNLDRPKRAIRETGSSLRMNEYLILRDRVRAALVDQLGFVIMQSDFS